MWIYNPAAQNYGIYSSSSSVDEGTNNVSRYIAPTQGFLVQAASAGTLQFNNTARNSDGRSIWKVRSAVASSILSVKVSSDADGSDEIQYMFNKMVDATGAAKLFSPVATAPSLYLKVNGENYSTSYLADSVGRRVLPVEFKAGNMGSYTLKCSYTSNGINSVLLQDVVEKTLTDLTQPGTSYTFKADASSSNSSRFILYVNTQPGEIAIGWDAKVYKVSDKLIVDLSALTGNYLASIVDASGKVLVSRKAMVGGEKVAFDLQVRGVYIVTISNDTETKVHKVVY